MLRYSCLEKPMDRGAWWATVYRVTESDTTGHSQHTHVQKRSTAEWPWQAMAASAIQMRNKMNIF